MSPNALFVGSKIGFRSGLVTMKGPHTLDLSRVHVMLGAKRLGDSHVDIMECHLRLRHEVTLPWTKATWICAIR